MTGTAPARTAVLAAVLALTGAGLATRVRGGPLLLDAPALHPALLVVSLAALFVLVDLCPLHFEVRREALSVTLSSLPLTLGVLLAGPWQLVCARLLGAAVAYAFARSAPLKVGYNLAAYTFEGTLVLSVLHLVAHPQAGLDLHLAAACVAVVLLVDQLMGLLVVQVVSWHQGRPATRQVAAAQVSGLVASALSTTGAYAVLLVSAQGPVGALVLVVLSGVAAVVQHRFRRLHRRHEALASVHAFVGLHDHDADLADLLPVLLGQVRALMRASGAELVLTDPGAPLHLAVDEDGVPRSLPPDTTVEEVLRDGQAVLLPRGTRDGDLRGWLDARGVRDAVVAPLDAADGRSAGALLVVDRLGGTGSFTREDRTLLATLAGHLAVAVSSGRRRERLRHDATHDALTGLGNRVLLAEAVTAALAAGRDAGRPDGAFVLLLDLDRFKDVNDTLGHHVGDALLVLVADRLRAALPQGSTVVRLGGDEFAALVPGGGSGAPAERAATVAAELAAALAVPAALAEATLSTRASMGLALVGSQSTASLLLRQADTAMYAAKSARTVAVVHTSELDRGRAERLALLHDLHVALERDELTVLYQPKRDLRTGRIPSVEALVRWQHPRLGELGPDAFVPLAEADGLIGPLTRVVLRKALAQCATWQRQGLDVAVAVNLSARTVNDPELPEQISAALLAAGVPASRLILEITESAVMEDPERAVAILTRIAAIGVTLSLDDFGTGYSSLSYLQRLPVREVKIDRSFVTRLSADDGRTQVLVRSVLTLCAGLDLRVVAEGVEDAATLELLRELGCDLVQGYHVSRPLAPELLAPLLAAAVGPRPRLRAVVA